MAVGKRIPPTPYEEGVEYRHPRQLLTPARIPGVVALVVLAVLASYLTVIQQFDSAYCARPGTDQSFERLARTPSTVLSYVDDDLELRRQADNQCTGVTDRAGSFLLGPSSQVSADDAAVARLTELITAENGTVEQLEQDGGIPVKKIVVASMFSSGDDQSTRSLSAGVNELRGALIAQKLWNDQRNDPNPRAHPPFHLSLLVANLGGNSAHAVDTAERIRALAERDPSVLGVTGMGQSREETLRAVDILGAPGGETRPDGLFVMGSVVSGDGFTGKRNFFRIAPDNRYQVEQLVRFAERRFPQYQWSLVPDAGVGNSGRSDPYSDDLSRGLSGMLRQSRTLSPGSVRPYYSGRATSLVDLANVAADICTDSTRSGRPAAIFYTGRANEVSSLLDGINATPCGTSAVVIGGDDMSQLETTRFAELQKPFDYRSGQLYYSTFGPSVIDRSTLPYDAAGSALLSRFRDAYQRLAAHEPAAFGSPTNGHIDAAFDAVHTTAGVARDTHNPSPTELGCTLKRRGGTPYSGLTGRLRISGDCARPTGADPAAKMIVFQRVVGPPGNRYVEQLEFSGTP